MPRPLGSAHRMSAPYQAFRCADGYITVGAANDRTFGKLATLLGHPEWTADPRFATDARRVRASRGAGGVDRGGHRDALAARSGCSGWRPRASRAARSTTMPRCSPTRRSRRARWPSSVDHPTLGRAAHARHADQDVGDAADLSPARAAARRTHRVVLRELGFAEQRSMNSVADAIRCMTRSHRRIIGPGLRLS